MKMKPRWRGPSDGQRTYCEEYFLEYGKRQPSGSGCHVYLARATGKPWRLTFSYGPEYVNEITLSAKLSTPRAKKEAVKAMIAWFMLRLDEAVALRDSMRAK